MSKDQRRQQDIERITKAVLSLGEFYDAVQIFATRQEQGQEGGTVFLDEGCGNIAARYGQVRQWVIAQDEIIRHHTRRSEIDRGSDAKQ